MVSVIEGFHCNLLHFELFVQSLRSAISRCVNDTTQQLWNKSQVSPSPFCSRSWSPKGRCKTTRQQQTGTFDPQFSALTWSQYSPNESHALRFCKIWTCTRWIVHSDLFSYSLDVYLLLTNQLQLTPSLHEFFILVH